VSLHQKIFFKKIGVLSPQTRFLPFGLLKNRLSTVKLRRIWVFVNYSSKKAFIYDIRIFPQYQKKGLAKSAIKELEETLKKENVKSLELNVFGNNKVAYNLYKNLGFTETYINLMKGFQKQKVVTLPKFLKFLENLFLKSGYRIVAIEMRKKIK
jgi:GNAT superfamily N-acetyltransferase